MILHYIKVAFRNLLKYKAQNILSTIGLVVGLLCFSICFYCSRYMQNMDQCFRHYDRLVDIRLIHDEENLSGTPPVLGNKLRKDMGHVMEAYSSVAYSDDRPFEVYVDTAKHLPYTFNCIEVDSLYNRLFTPVFVAGSWEIASQTPNAIVLTESTALNIFSNVREAIGKQFILACQLQSSPDTTPRTGGISYTVQAVIKDIPTNISMSFMQKIEVLILNDSEGIFWNTSDGNNYTGAYTYALLRKGQKAQEVDQMFRASGVTHRIFGTDYQVVISPIGKEVKSASATTVLGWITGVIGMLIGLVALLNFFHLQLGNMLSRRHEFSIRKVLGNGTFQLFVMLFVQLFFVIVIAFVLMLALVDLLSPKLQLSMFDLNLNIDKYTLMLQSGQYFLAILALSTVVCFWVAVYIRRISIQTGISRGSKKGKNVFRSFMQGVQFFICWLFVSITVALYLQSERTTSALFETLSKDEKNSILSLPLDYTFMKNEEKLGLVQRIRQYSGVKEVLLSDISYLVDGVSSTGIQLEKNNRDKYVQAEVMRINSNFRSFMNIPLLSGRDIQSGSEMFVDQVFVEKTHKDILGKTLYQYNDEYVVSGVLGSFCASVYSNRSNSEQAPVVFLPSDFNDYVGHCYIKCHEGKEKEVATRVMQILKELLPENVEPAISTFQEDINEAQALETKLKDIILFFSIVSLIITLLGVYTAITLDTEHRQKEVAIRKINGAGIKHIVLLFTRLYLWILSITALLSFPIVYVILMQWKTMYKVFFNDGILYWGGIFLGVTLLVAFTVLSRILKIVRINPAEIIKSE